MEVILKSDDQSGMNTKCVHSGIDEYQFGAVVPPIYQTSTFKFKSSDHGARLFNGEEDGYIYTRMRNPTIEAMEDAIASLEDGAKSLGCASGMAAIHTLIAYCLKSGDHIICSESVYGPTTTLISTIFSKYGIEYDFVDTSKITEVESKLRSNTKLIFVETPANPTLVISDIEAIANMAHSNNAKLVVDNTFMSPALQKPLKFGADYVIHSLTKFLNGHADVVGGVIVLKNMEEYSLLRKFLNHVGGVIDPFNSFLVHRGLKTLSLRMERHSQSAMKIAEYLHGHPKVDWIIYPGLKSHPQYEVGLKQMSGFGGMISFELKGGYNAGKILMDNIKLWTLAVSLGGVESLIQHPASMTHSGMDRNIRIQAKITDGLVRLSVGIEDVEDLISALDDGLNLL